MSEADPNKSPSLVIQSAPKGEHFKLILELDEPVKDIVERERSYFQAIVGGLLYGQAALERMVLQQIAEELEGKLKERQLRCRISIE